MAGWLVDQVGVLWRTLVRRIPQGCASWFSKGTWRTSSLTALELRLLVRENGGTRDTGIGTFKQAVALQGLAHTEQIQHAHTTAAMASVVLDQQMMRHFGGRETRTLRDRKYMGAPPFVSPFSASSKADSFSCQPHFDRGRKCSKIPTSLSSHSSYDARCLRETKAATLPSDELGEAPTLAVERPTFPRATLQFRSCFHAGRGVESTELEQRRPKAVRWQAGSIMACAYANMCSVN